MIFQDDRTDEQKQSHPYIVVARDNFMSGWGGARNGFSRCAWACATFEDTQKVLAWVRSRREMRYVRWTYASRYRAPRGTAHFHIYVAGDHHPALSN